VDEELTEPHQLVVIGGAAIGMIYAPRYETEDLDSTTQSDTVLREAIERGRAKMRERERLEPYEPLVQFTMVFNAPYEYEDRLRALRIRGLRYLRVVIPERHDIALMKTSRGQSRDRNALAAMHARRKFDLRTLVARYDETRQVYVGNVRELRLNFLALVGELFGEDAADKLAPNLEA
jgi:hypothetical protein